MSRPGDVLGRYQILCPIGAGGMASVYAARVVGEAAFEKLVALKVMLPHLSRDPRFERMFADEAKVAAQIQSPNVVGTIDLGRDEQEGLFMVLELVLGASLRQLTDDGSLPVPVALSILAQAARGLRDAHDAKSADGTPLGLVHRDVSPHNVLVGVDGRARLADFGVARAAARVSQTESGELKGKLGYASPEQLAGKVLDARSDVFSLGIVAWEMLAGRRLFDADNPLALVDLLVHQPIPSLVEVRPEVSPEVAAIVAGMLERELGARIATAGEVAARLEELGRVPGTLASADEVAALVRERGGEPLVRIEREIKARLAEPPPVTPPPRAAPPARGLSTGVAALAVVGAVVVVALSTLDLGGAAGDTTRATGLGGAPDAGVPDAPVEPALLDGGFDAGPSVGSDEGDDVVGDVVEGDVVEGDVVEGDVVEGDVVEGDVAGSRTRARRRGEEAVEPPPPPEPAEPPAASEEPTARPHERTTGGLLGVEEFDRE